MTVPFGEDDNVAVFMQSPLCIMVPRSYMTRISLQLATCTVLVHAVCMLIDLVEGN